VALDTEKEKLSSIGETEPTYLGTWCGNYLGLSAENWNNLRC